MRRNSPGSSSRTGVAPMRSNAQVSEATTCPSPSRPSQSGRKPRASTIGVQRAADGQHQGVGALDALQRVEDLVFDLPRLGAGDEVHQHLAVRGGLEDRALVHEIGAQLDGVGEVAVVAEGQRALAVAREDRLGVGEDRAAGGGVAGVADRDVAGEPGEDRLGEDVRRRGPCRGASGRHPRRRRVTSPADSWPRCCRLYSPR